MLVHGGWDNSSGCNAVVRGLRAPDSFQNHAPTHAIDIVREQCSNVVTRLPRHPRHTRPFGHLFHNALAASVNPMLGETHKASAAG